MEIVRDISLFSGEPVEVLRPIEGELDDMGESLVTWEPEIVENVLCSPSSTDDMEATRPNGVVVSMTFHFPKTYTKSLRGCKITYQDNTYRVIGDPMPYMKNNTPGTWNRPALTEVAYG